MLRELREATSEVHERLERKHPLAAGTLTRSSYVALTRAHYGLYCPLEQRLEPFAAGFPGLDWAARRKTPRLHTDLSALGLSDVEIERIPVCRTLPTIVATADALGVLYVVEGATLGGRILQRRVQSRLGIDAHDGASFLAGYGEATGIRWRRFIDCLATLENRACRDRAVRLAVATFLIFETWLLMMEGLGE